MKDLEAVRGKGKTEAVAKTENNSKSRERLRKPKRGARKYRGRAPGEGGGKSQQTFCWLRESRTRETREANDKNT